MQNPWLIKDTFELIGVVERIKPPAKYLVSTFFPNSMPATTTNGYVAVEYRKEGRLLAPYIVRGTRGVNVNRGGSKINLYKAPMVGPRRVIGLADIELRQFGELPVYSKVKAEDRARRMQAQDLGDLMNMIENRKAKMAADLIQTGQTKMRGYADDGVTVVEDLIKFDWDGKVTATKDWSKAGAPIYDDIKAVSDRIQEDSGFIPTLMLCGKNVERYLLNNEEIFKWLSIPNRENLTMASFCPHYTSPQARFVGHISALNLEIISYAETYTDDDGIVKPYIDPDTVIIANPGKGRQLYGSMTFMNKTGDWQTFNTPIVPIYNADFEAQQSSLTLYSRFVLVPELMDDWAVINTRGNSSTDPAPADDETVTDGDIDNLFNP